MYSGHFSALSYPLSSAAAAATIIPTSATSSTASAPLLATGEWLSSLLSTFAKNCLLFVFAFVLVSSEAGWFSNQQYSGAGAKLAVLD